MHIGAHIRGGRTVPPDNWPGAGIAAAVVAVVLILFSAGVAIPTEPDDGDKLFQHWERQLETAQERIDSGVLGPLSSRAFRRLVQEVMGQVNSDRAQSTEQARQTEELLESFGPAPEDGAEDPTIQAKRAELTAQLARYKGRVKRADLIVARAKQILDELARLSRLRFQENLLQTAASPLVPGSWAVAAPEFADWVFRSFIEAPADWVSAFAADPERGGKAFSLILIALAVAAFVEAVARGLIPVLFVLGVIVLFTDDALLGFVLRVVVEGAAGHLVIFFIGYGLIRAVFTPDRSAWRLTPLHSGASKRVVRALQRVLITFVVFGGIAPNRSPG